MTKDVQDKLKEVDETFTAVKEQAKALQEEVNKGNRQLQAYKDELTRLQGEYRALNSLLPEKERKVPEVKEKKK